MNLRQLSFAVLTFAISTAAVAHDYRVGDISVDHPYARATVAGQTSGGAYLTLENKGNSADTLISAKSPVAASVEIHTMSMTADHVMRMREVGTLEIKAKEKIAMQPGDGYHIMLIGLKSPLKVGDKLPLTLTFKKAGKIETSIFVEDGKKKSEETDSMEHHHH
ncbi:copper chaperone PCu(A)C [Herminiimonas arsenitoxidans]|uniref:copper chaperone PCu(A)C n=1 Tax=Herminiimonas arsenitoxidans TaxID=1809410 RepID=UPI0009703EC7|nr:copper chaperone PCu(A)C [Herminiimonas arsenitoxidans]